ncbi:MAG: TonB-dependent receptor, partial [Pseudomonadota bacterium]|nr:TonB-dependent receptor [Pseudomonadota bacterium]
MKMQTNFKKKTLAAIVAATVSATTGFSGGVLAQDDDNKSSEGLLETIVVVGEATNALITAEDLELYQANDLADVFRHTPSINVGGSLGIAQKIYVRGLEDSYVNVTVDGAPQTSTLFHHIGRVNVDPALLKEVEVQSGAGEATGGAGAIGGAIRFKTKDVNDLLAADEYFGGSVKANYFSNDGQQNSITLFGRLSDSWGVLAYYNDTDRDNIDDGDGDETLGTASDQNLGFFKISGNITDNQTLSLSYEKRDEEADFSARPNWYVAPGSPLYKSEAERETYIANYTLELNELVNLETTVYNTEQSYVGGRFDWLAEITTKGFDIRNTSQLGDHKFVYGIDYREDEVISDGAFGGNRLKGGEDGEVLGVYAQVHSQLTDELLLSYGARYDDYEYKQSITTANGVPITNLPGAIAGTPSKFDESDVSYNVGLAYQVTDAWLLGIGYAEAFRGKEIGDGFTFAEAPVTGSIAEGLDGESVSNIEASAEYTGQNLNFKVAVFQSEIDDVILDIPDRRTAYYQNVGTVENRGFEMSMTYSFDDFEAFVAFSSVDSEIDYDTISITNGARMVVETELRTSDINAHEHRGLGASVGD